MIHFVTHDHRIQRYIQISWHLVTELMCKIQLKKITVNALSNFYQ